jgi:endonuclease/exonuclease/phosphatase family metal-dependent hydrolase
MAGDETIRLLSYNVRSLRDGADRVAAVIRACSPDLACLQEAPRLARWRTKRAALARESGLLVATADRVGGLAILAGLRVDVRATAFAALPKTRGLQQRALVCAEVVLAGQRLAVGCTHLGVDAAERERHAPEVRRRLDVSSSPAVLAGDFNAKPGSPPRMTLARHWADPCREATYPARAARRSIDAVLAAPGVEIVSCGVPEVPGLVDASDHLPVLATLRLAGA